MQIVIVNIRPRPREKMSNLYGAFLCSIKTIKKDDMVVVSRKQGKYYAIGQVVEVDPEGSKYQANDYVVSKLLSDKDRISERIKNLKPISANNYMLARQTPYNYLGYDIREYGLQVVERTYEDWNNGVYSKIRKGIMQTDMNDLEKHGLISILNSLKGKYYTTDKEAIRIILDRISAVKPYVDEDVYEQFLQIINSIRVSRPATPEEIETLKNIRKRLKKKRKAINLQKRLEKEQEDAKKKKNKKKE